METARDRVELLLIDSSLTKTRFAALAGIDPANFAKKLRGMLTFTLKDLEKISAYTGASLSWLQYGECDKGNVDYSEKEKKESITLGNIPGMLPEVSFSFAAGQTQLISERENINRHWYLPDCTDCDAVVPIEGNSMLPNIPPGSFAVLKRFHVTANNPNSIPFGQVFGIVVEDENTGEYHGYIKVIRRYKDEERSRQCWIAHSFNPEYDDFDIHLSQVRSLWIVKQHIVSNMAY